MTRLTRRQAALSAPLAAVPEGIALGARSEADAEFVERARARVSALYEERGEEFFHYAMGLARDQELARDAVQEAFMRYFVALYRGEQITSPRPWIYRVLHNYLLDRLREGRSRNERPLCNALNCREVRNVETDCFRKEVLEQVRGTLTEREYDCFCLRSEGLRYEEIARRLELTSGTVGALLCRAVRKLRTLLSRQVEGER